MDKWYVEFSVKQNCFHMDTLKKIKEMNLSLCKRKIVNGYVIIGGEFSFKEASAFIDKMTPLLMNKQRFCEESK